jgi:hypothetical protein
VNISVIDVALFPFTSSVDDEGIFCVDLSSTDMFVPERR